MLSFLFYFHYLCFNAKKTTMKKQADYIKRIEIRGLWGRKNISWDLNPDVNILSGVNGGGKSTILNKSVNTLDVLEGGALDNDLSLNVRFVFSPEDANFIHYDVIRSFDRPLLHGDLMEKMADKNVKSELDWQLYQLQRRYLDYQVNVGNRIIESLTSGHPEEATLISLTSVTASIQPSMIIAGECVVSTICTLGFSSRISEIRRCCHSTCNETSGSSIKSTPRRLSCTNTVSRITSICFSPEES